jgi:hypothetical protein
MLPGGSMSAKHVLQLLFVKIYKLANNSLLNEARE